MRKAIFYGHARNNLIFPAFFVVLISCAAPVTIEKQGIGQAYQGGRLNLPYELSITVDYPEEQIPWPFEEEHVEAAAEEILNAFLGPRVVTNSEVMVHLRFLPEIGGGREYAGELQLVAGSSKTKDVLYSAVDRGVYEAPTGIRGEKAGYIVVFNTLYASLEKLGRELQTSPDVLEEATGKDAQTEIPATDEELRRQEEFRQALALEFVRIPGGEFMMGSEDGSADERPMHKVRIDTFELGKTEVTQAQWEQVMGGNPSKFQNCLNCPADTVSWLDIQLFLSKLNQLTGMQLRLPTEAEWEYAASGGGEHEKWAGTDFEEGLKEFAWYFKGTRKERRIRRDNTSYPVGQKKPNIFGLYDMSGNVWEWCRDWYDEYYYSMSPEENPPGASAGVSKVLRGGSRRSDASGIRVTTRYALMPIVAFAKLGFRVARDVSQ